MCKNCGSYNQQSSNDQDNTKDKSVIHCECCKCDKCKDLLSYLTIIIVSVVFSYTLLAYNKILCSDLLWFGIVVGVIILAIVLVCIFICCKRCCKNE